MGHLADLIRPCLDEKRILSYTPLVGCLGETKHLLVEVSWLKPRSAILEYFCGRHLYPLAQSKPYAHILAKSEARALPGFVKQFERLRKHPSFSAFSGLLTVCLTAELHPDHS